MKTLLLAVLAAFALPAFAGGNHTPAPAPDPVYVVQEVKVHDGFDVDDYTQHALIGFAGSALLQSQGVSQKKAFLYVLGAAVAYQLANGNDNAEGFKDAAATVGGAGFAFMLPPIEF